MHALLHLSETLIIVFSHLTCNGSNQMAYSAVTKSVQMSKAFESFMLLVNL